MKCRQPSSVTWVIKFLSRKTRQPALMAKVGDGIAIHRCTYVWFSNTLAVAAAAQGYRKTELSILFHF